MTLRRRRKYANGGLEGVDIDESTLGNVPEADKLDGGDLCRTSGPVSVPLFSAPQVLCTSGSLSLEARCSGPATTPPNYPDHGTLRLASSADNSFAAGSFGDGDVDTGESVALVDVSTSAPGETAAGTTRFAAGNPDGSQLVGSVGVRVVNASGPSASDGRCDFVIGATN